MRASISKSEIVGRVTAPSSKSYTIRGLMCAALARGESEIIHPLTSDDTEASLGVLNKLGVYVNQKEEVWRVTGGNLRTPDTDLFCGESAATLRFMTAICSLIPGKCRLVAGPSLSQRPVRPLVEALRQLGVNCSCQGELPPVTVEGDEVKGGLTELPGDISSQFVSALLFISPFAEDDVTIRLTTPLESKPFVLMTIDCLRKFGIEVEYSRDLEEFKTSKQSYKPGRYSVEGDWSSASYLLALGAISGEVEVENLNPNSLQGDKVILEFLKDMGASVIISKDSVKVCRSKLKAIRADLTDCIDLLPTVAVLAAVADGTSELTGIGRARIKESDRVAAVREGLEKMGIEVTEGKDRMTIVGGHPRGSVIDSRDDHRIAMAFSLPGSAVGATIIDDAECVAKTYPEFWDVLKSIGGEVKIDEK
jgi:3-phosphoshikimate 1-carboxyvinyltransferase